MTATSHHCRDDLGKGPFRKDGRLIVSYPKSGRSWLSFAFGNASVGATFTHAGASTNRREIGRPFQGVPSQLADLPLVFLHRNPIDTAVSLFYQVTKRDLRRGTLRSYRMWLPLALKGRLPPGDIDSFVLHPHHGIAKLCAYNRAWLDHLALRTDCLILTYEDMRSNPAAGFQKLLDFWGESKTTGAQLAELSTFDKMKAAEANRSQQGTQTSLVQQDPDSVKVRKGKVRGYLDELRPETIARCRDIMVAHGFDPDESV